MDRQKPELILVSARSLYVDVLCVLEVNVVKELQCWWGITLESLGRKGDRMVILHLIITRCKFSRSNYRHAWQFVRVCFLSTVTLYL